MQQERATPTEGSALNSPVSKQVCRPGLLSLSGLGGKAGGSGHLALVPSKVRHYGAFPRTS